MAKKSNRFADLDESQSSQTSSQTEELQVGLERGDLGDVLNKPDPGDIIVYPEWDPHFKSGGSPIASPSTLSGVASAPTELSSVPSEVIVDGTIGAPGEVDLYSISLAAGQTYIFSVYGSGATPIEDTLLYIGDDTLTVVAEDDDGGAGRMSLITYTADYSGTHYLAVGGWSTLTGDYTLDAVATPGFDVVGDTFGSAEPLTIGSIKYGYIDPGPGVVYGPSYGEVDTFAFAAEAGKIYTIEVAGGADYASDWFALPPGEIDTVAAIYDPSGNFVTFNDDISFPSDISSRITFQAAETGTYYLDVFSWAPWTGGFSITSQEIDLSALDPLDSLIWESANNVAFDESNTAYVYFGDSDENFDQTGDNGGAMVTIDWNDYEKQQVMLALEEYENILGVNYEITDDVDEATFRLLKTESQQYGAYFFPQDPSYGASQGVGVFNVLSGGWNFDQQQSLLQGGFSFGVVLHEFGHAHGLAHPHDTGGGSEVLFGVTASQGSFGVYDLNQGVYTVMSYNDAWQLHPDGPSPYTAAGIDNGWSGTLSAFDIAAQERYGVINPHNTGNDVYEIGKFSKPGTYYETIWDTGGTDTIVYGGDTDAQIDLLAATIDYSPTGGGAMSYARGVYGGYTIAHGVVIENAVGGKGNDIILGNEVANNLSGGGQNGDDTLMGREGDDTLEGGRGEDVLHGGADNDLLLGGNDDDVLNGGAGDDTLVGGNGDDIFEFTETGGTDIIQSFKKGHDVIDLSGLDAIDGGGHDAFAWIGSSAFSNTAGELRAYAGPGGKSFIEGDTDGDGSADFTIVTNVHVTASDFIFS